jgi:alpha,alpha-trehalose-phosphate synthase [UDP-forming]
MPEQKRLVVVSNRLPVVLESEDGEWTARPGAGGLVTALTPVLGHRGGLWVGWPGITSEQAHGNWQRKIVQAFRRAGYDLVPVLLEQAQLDSFYAGFSNQVLWPLFHDLLESCRFKPTYWSGYLEVNELFAEEVRKWRRKGDLIWVQDYQLIHAAHFLRRRQVENRIAFFLHIPFPQPDVFKRLPWRREVVRALLDYDLVGFQTLRDRNNFIGCARELVPEARISAHGAVAKAKVEGRELGIGGFPISIDFRKFAADARQQAVSLELERLRRQTGEQRVILGLDRLDYTKGLPERLRGFRTLLDRHPEWQGKVTLLQVVVPSRERVKRYRELKAELDRLVGLINGRFASAGWIPVNYQFRSLDRTELLAHYRLADVMLVTSLKDGMNLVAKEYCASRNDDDGVLILSEFAGATSQLGHHALVVNPFDSKGVGGALHQALTMDEQERRERMRGLRGVIRRRDIFWWVRRFLEAAAGARLEEYAAELAEDL